MVNRILIIRGDLMVNRILIIRGDLMVNRILSIRGDLPYDISPSSLISHLVPWNPGEHSQ